MLRTPGELDHMVIDTSVRKDGEDGGAPADELGPGRAWAGFRIHNRGGSAAVGRRRDPAGPLDFATQLDLYW